MLVSSDILDLWEKTFVERQVTPASAKYRITWKSEMIWWWKSNQWDPIHRHPKNQLLQDTTYMLKFLKCSLFIETSAMKLLRWSEAFIWCFYRSLLRNVQFVIYKPRLILRISFKEFLRWNTACTGNFCWHSRKFFCYHFLPQPLILILRNASQITFENTLLRISFPKVQPATE